MRGCRGAARELFVDGAEKWLQNLQAWELEALDALGRDGPEVAVGAPEEVFEQEGVPVEELVSLSFD